MSQIAVLNQSRADDAEVAFACKAVDAQLREDFCPRWGDEVAYQPVTFFASSADLPVAAGISVLATIVERQDDPVLAAYHSFAGVSFIRIARAAGDLSVLLSHEVLEESADPYCLKVRDLPGGGRGALEPCDPVQAWTYDKLVTVLGETRQVPVSAFALPAWFSGATGPTYFCPGRHDELTAGRVADGGYLPVVSFDGIWDRIFGAGADRALVESKATAATSRARRRAGKAWGPSRP